MKKTRLVIIAGVSGAGNTTALNAFRDNGFYCVDNLPAQMISSFVEIIKASSISTSVLSSLDSNSTERASKENKYERDYALLINFREDNFFSYIQRSIEGLKDCGIDVFFLYLDCLDEVIVRRYRETRRPHPLLIKDTLHQTIAQALSKERAMVADFREAASRVIDTSAFSARDLRSYIDEYCGSKVRHLQITLLSFGYKYGVPQDADLLVDIRFLPNPYYVENLRNLTGEDTEVYNYVFKCPDTRVFIEHYLNFLLYLIPKYKEEGKRYLTLAIGCTGGQHRSVAVVRYLDRELNAQGFNCQIRHRDIA